MAKSEHVKIIKKGAKAWNEWRRHANETRAPFEYKGKRFDTDDFNMAFHEWAVEGTLDLSEAKFEGAELQGVNLSAVNLAGSNFNNARLRRADLSGADARGAKFKGADLSGVDISRALLDGADLSGATLDGATIRDCSLDSVNLTDAHIGRVAYDYEGLGFLASGYTCFANVDPSVVLKGLTVLDTMGVHH